MDLKEISKKAVEEKNDRQINRKNLIKIIIVGVLIAIFIVAGIQTFFGSSEEKVVKEENQEEQTEKNTAYELNDVSYENNRQNILAADNRLNQEYVSEDDYDNPDYNIPAEDPDPIADYIKEQELEKVKRYYEARKSPFKGRSEKIDNASNVDIDGNERRYSDPAYLNNSDYLNYIMAGVGDTQSNPNMQKEKLQFLKNAAVDNFVLNAPLVPSITKYEVKTGTLIPVTLASSINSDLPGSITAIVREDVYDTNTGMEKLIPAGSKLFGKFSSQISWGQTRVQAVFTRLTLPNGKSINLGAMGVSDLEGKSGLTGDVDLHIGKVIGSVIMAGIVGGAEGALTNNGSYDKEGNAALAVGGEAAGRRTVETIDKFTSKVLDVQPTITVDFGTRATLVVEQDIILERYDKEIEYLKNY